MEQVIGALNRAASSNAVVNTFMGAVFCALAARSYGQAETIHALEAEKDALLKSNKQMKTTIWEWKQALYAEAKANPKKALVPLATLQTIYGDVVTPVSQSVEIAITVVASLDFVRNYFEASGTYYITSGVPVGEGRKGIDHPQQNQR